MIWYDIIVYTLELSVLDTGCLASSGPEYWGGFFGWELGNPIAVSTVFHVKSTSVPLPL